MLAKYTINWIANFGVRQRAASSDRLMRSQRVLVNINSSGPELLCDSMGLLIDHRFIIHAARWIIQRSTRIRLGSSDMGSDCDDDTNIIGDKLFAAMWDSRQLPTTRRKKNWFSRHAIETECRLHSRRAAFFVQSTGKLMPLHCGNYDSEKPAKLADELVTSSNCAQRLTVIVFYGEFSFSLLLCVSSLRRNERGAHHNLNVRS